MSHIARYLKQWSKENRITLDKLERQLGLSNDRLYAIARGKHRMSAQTFAVVHPVVNFPPECFHEVRQTEESLRKVSRDSTRKPWPQTVRELKQQPPIYARAWA